MYNLASSSHNMYYITLHTCTVIISELCFEALKKGKMSLTFMSCIIIHTYIISFDNWSSTDVSTVFSWINQGSTLTLVQSSNTNSYSYIILTTKIYFRLSMRWVNQKMWYNKFKDRKIPFQIKKLITCL